MEKTSCCICSSFKPIFYICDTKFAQYKITIAMKDITELQQRLEYHKQQIQRLEIAISVLSEDSKGNGVVSATDHTKPRLVIDATWTHKKKIMYFINQLNRFVLPKEIQELYEKNGWSCKSILDGHEK